MKASQGRLALVLLLTALLMGPACQVKSAPEPSAAVSTDTDQAPDAWPRFRGPGGMGVSEATGLPLTWAEGDGIAWKTPLPGAGASSPIVHGGHIYLTCYTGYMVPGESEGRLEDLRRVLLCLSAEDGTVLWQQAVPAKLPEESRIRDHGYAASTPVADSDGVYVFHGKSGVFAYDHAGNPRWQADVGTGTNGWGTAASPVIHGELLLVNASVESESLVALDRRTGEGKWRTDGIKESWNTPLVVTAASGAPEIVVAALGKVLGIDPSSGGVLWSCDTDITWYMVPSAVAADGNVYFLGGRSGTRSLAVRAGGRGDVTQSHRLWTSTQGSNVSSPVYHGGRLYYAQDTRGTAHCLQADSGEVLYEETLPRAGQFYASALLADGRLYYLDRSGRTFVVAAKPGFELLSVNELRDGSMFNASPVVMGRQLLLRSDKFLYCIGG